MTKIRFFIAILLAACLGVGPANAEPEILRNETHYDITGKTIGDLKRALTANGPRDQNDGSRVWALTSWYVQWRYDYEPLSTTGCALAGVTTTVTLDFTFPRWANKDDGTQRARKAWRQMTTALRKHEETHGQHGVEAAREIERALSAMKPRTSCATMGEAANQRGTQIIEQFVARDIKYDKDTNHGLREGVTLP